MPEAAVDTSKPATEKAVLSPQEMSDAQLTDFFAKGTRFEKEPDAPESDPPSAAQPADSAPADAVDPAASTDASHEAASETAKPEKKAKGKAVAERNLSLRAEIEENTRLLAERRRLREELARESAPPQTSPKPAAQPTDSAPAATEPTEADFKRYLAMPGAPKAEQFDGDLDAYTAAMGTFIAKQITKEQFESMFNEREQKHAAQSKQDRELGEVITAAEERAKADEAHHPNWREQIDPTFADIPPLRMLGAANDARAAKGLPPLKPGPLLFIKDFQMFKAKHPVSLAIYMSSPEGKQWVLGTLVKLSPEDIIAELAIKDASFAASPDDDEQPPSHVSAAPPPGPTLGRKPSAPVDPLKAAIAANDPEAFINARNKEVVGKR